MACYPGDFLTIKNLSPFPVTLQWDGRRTTIPPRSTGMATFEQVSHTFGDPYSTETEDAKIIDPFGNFRYVPSRQQECKRLSNKGWTLGSVTQALLEPSPTPKIETYDPDGNRIYTVVEDPTGERAAPRTPSEQNHDEQIKMLERQLEILKHRIGANDIDVHTSNPDAPTDD